MTRNRWSRRQVLAGLFGVPAAAVLAQAAGGAGEQQASPSPSPKSEGASGLAAETESFPRVIKLLGGPGFPDLKGQENWDNTITISADSVTFEFARGKYPPIVAPVRDLTSIVYGQASSRHVGRWVAVGVLLAPIALLGLFHKQRKHNVLVSWQDEAGQDRGAYFEVNKAHFRRLLNTLTYRSGKAVLADQKDRTWLRTQGVAAIADPAEGKSEK